jgi:hypothetical protein
VLSFIENLFKSYPQLKAAILTVAVAVAAKLGFHLTPDWFLGVISAAVALFHSFAAVGAARAKADAAGEARLDALRG